MILTRAVLNPYHARTYALVGDPYRLHQRLCQVYSAGRAEASVLYRIEEGPVLLVQSAAEPDWSLFGESPQIFRSPPESKPFDPTFATGQALAFRLRCRPSKKLQIEGAKNSRFRFLRTDEERLAWLGRQGEARGFAVESALAVEERWRDTKDRKRPEAPDQETAYRDPVDLPATRFDGILVVTDADKLRLTVETGIGPQKAYGFGLLSLAPIG